MKEVEITQEQLNAWKKEHGEIHKLTVDDKIAYLHKPDRTTLRLAFSKAATDPLGMTEVVLDNCWLGGDDEIKTDDSYFMGAMGQVDKIINVRTGSLEKL